MNVLIVDDDDFALDVLEQTMARMGYNVVSAQNGKEAMGVLRRGDIHLVITDWDMPAMNGIDLCRAIRGEELAGYVYIIMLTGREGAKQRMAGLCAGADAFLNKPLDPEELLVSLKNAERILALETRDVALFSLAKLAESRDSETGTHVERVQSYSRLIARNLSDEVKTRHGVDEEYIRLLYQTSPLHDLGKVGIPDSVLLKPGKLTADEFAIMKTHTLIGAQTLDAALRRFPNARFLQLARNIAATHHERFDGTGYPMGMVGEQIPLCGRIVAIADVYDALTSRRVYKRAFSHEQARETILAERGRHFDPDVVDSFIRAERQIVSVSDTFRDVPASPVESQMALADPPAVIAGPSPCKMLIVEDDPIVRQKLIKLLTATGEPVFAAADGEEAMQIVAEQTPRVVVSDWVMPRMDGVDLCRRIRSASATDPTHFIMLTAHSDKSRLLDAYQAGVDDFVSKPFDPEELLARVRAGIRSAKVRDDLHRRAIGSQARSGELALVNSRLEQLTITDELTGLFNRRHAMSRMEEQWSLADRYNRPLTIAAIDVDHFKEINDTYGHDAGDAVLKQIAALLREKTRTSDAVCRVGGDEFLIIFPSQTVEEAAVCTERFRMAVKAHSFKIGGRDIATSASIGLASRQPDMAQFPDLLKCADIALYEAKRAGRGVSRVADETESQGAPGRNLVSAIPPGDATVDVTARGAAVNLEAVIGRCGGDSAFATALLDRFEKQAGVEVDKIQQALAAGDADAVHRTAHRLKSMAAYVSADEAAQLAEKIEVQGRSGNLADLGALVAELRSSVDSVIAWIAARRPASAA